MVPVGLRAQVIADADKAKPSSTEYSNKDTVAWVYGGILNIGGNEGFLHNWAAGGEVASLAINGVFSGFVTYLNGAKVWTNNLDLSYGLNYTYSFNFKPRKTDDRIDFTSKYGKRLGDEHSNLYATGLMNFKSQFTRGYDYNLPAWEDSSTSNFFSPAYLTLAPGLEYRKGTNLSIFLSPAAARFTFVDAYYTNLDPAGAFGVEKGKTMRFELGAYFSARYMTHITRNITYRGRLDLYSNYLAKDVKDDAGNVVRKDNPGNITVLSDNLFSFKIARHINITLAMVFVYDNAVPYKDTYEDEAGVTKEKNEPLQGFGWLQVRQNLAIGFEYKFPVPKKVAAPENK